MRKALFRKWRCMGGTHRHRFGIVDSSRQNTIRAVFLPELARLGATLQGENGLAKTETGPNPLTLPLSGLARANALLT